MTREEFVAKFEGSSVKAAGILQAQDIARAEMESLKKYLRAGLTREGQRGLVDPQRPRSGAVWAAHHLLGARGCGQPL